MKRLVVTQQDCRIVHMDRCVSWRIPVMKEPSITHQQASYPNAEMAPDIICENKKAVMFGHTVRLFVERGMSVTDVAMVIASSDVGKPIWEQLELGILPDVLRPAW